MYFIGFVKFYYKLEYSSLGIYSCDVKVFIVRYIYNCNHFWTGLIVLYLNILWSFSGVYRKHQRLILSELIDTSAESLTMNRRRFDRLQIYSVVSQIVYKVSAHAYGVATLFYHKKPCRWNIDLSATYREHLTSPKWQFDPPVGFQEIALPPIIRGLDSSPRGCSGPASRNYQEVIFQKKFFLVTFTKTSGVWHKELMRSVADQNAKWFIVNK